MQREFPSHPLAGVGTVVVWRGSVLLVERRLPPLQGFWSVPGGLIELGEEARAAAAREVREETGIAVLLGAVLAVVDRIEYGPDGRVQYHYVITDFEARPLDDSPTLAPASDARQARWVAWDELPRYRLTPGLAEVLARATR